jgi:hypothetical protein
MDRDATAKSMPSLTRSKFSVPFFHMSHSNASWNVPELQESGSPADGETSIMSALRAPAYQSYALSQTRFEQVVDAAQDQEAVSWPRVSPRRPQLVDVDKMESLLKRLRTDSFAGTIDMQHHSRYLQPPLFEKQNDSFIDPRFSSKPNPQAMISRSVSASDA